MAFATMSSFGINFAIQLASQPFDHDDVQESQDLASTMNRPTLDMTKIKD